MIPILVIFIVMLLVWFGLPKLLAWSARRYMRNQQQKYYDYIRQQQARSTRAGTANPLNDLFAQMFGMGFDPETPQHNVRRRKIDPSQAEDVRFVEITQTYTYNSTDNGKTTVVREEQVTDIEWEDL